MQSRRDDFFKYVAQTADGASAIEFERAEGIYMYTPQGEKYVDLVSGVCVTNLGHSNPEIVEAVKEQVENHMHLMVYGEYVQKSQVEYAKMLVDSLPQHLNRVFYVNTGSEAIEGGMKLAKRYTGRNEMISFKNSYHGSTHGALSLHGEESFKSAYRPLVPQIKQARFNSIEDIELITNETAGVLLETVQAEAGILYPTQEFLTALRKKCDETGTMLIFDEVQVGFGRTGKLFAFERFGVEPDILLLAKAFGGGMPLGAFVANSEIMDTLKYNPALGHITTFGGHPVSCAAGMKGLEIILRDNLCEEAERKGEKFKSLLKHKHIKEIRGTGLFLAVELGDSELMARFFKRCVEEKILYDLFLFCDTAFRIAPPLTIKDSEIEEISNLFLKLLDEL
jgi:acetylornithine/succinyldiaminopimelate/putrescine aminotransferase